MDAGAGAGATQGEIMGRISVQKLEAQIDANVRAIAGYEKMLAVADEYGLEYELDRIPRLIDELFEDMNVLLAEMNRIQRAN
jgi:hypothetical protein